MCPCTKQTRFAVCFDVGGASPHNLAGRWMQTILVPSRPSAMVIESQFGGGGRTRLFYLSERPASMVETSQVPDVGCSTSMFFASAVRHGRDLTSAGREMQTIHVPSRPASMVITSRDNLVNPDGGGRTRLFFKIGLHHPCSSSHKCRTWDADHPCSRHNVAGRWMQTIHVLKNRTPTAMFGHRVTSAGRGMETIHVSIPQVAMFYYGNTMSLLW